MRTIQVISALMGYPRSELVQALPELAAAVQAEGLLEADQRNALLGFIDEMGRHSPLALQERYVALFDRGRALSLHLFEHVHGQSRDRGPAMVELMEIYRRNGFELSARELPDYLPLFLEYLSQCSADEARALLADAMPIVALLGARLAERGSDYRVLFEALEAFAGEPEEAEAIRRQAATEGPDETLVNLDKIWEEEAVTFMGNTGPDGCPSKAATPAVAPVHWVGRGAGDGAVPCVSSGGK